MAKNPDKTQKKSEELKSENTNAIPSISDVPEEVAKVIESLPNDKRQVILQAFSYRGPLPHSMELDAYNRIIPNGADRIMKQSESQTVHRIDMEKTGIKRTFNQSSTGQWMAFAIAIFFGIACWDLAKTGHEEAAKVIGGIDLVGLVTVFVVGRIFKK